jgi:hypothetical protein
MVLVLESMLGLLCFKDVDETFVNPKNNSSYPNPID